MSTEHFDTVVIGGGQAGLAVGSHLQQQGRIVPGLGQDQRLDFSHVSGKRCSRCLPVPAAPKTLG